MNRSIPILAAVMFLFSAVAVPADAQQTYPSKDGAQSETPGTGGQMKNDSGVPPDQAGPGIKAKDLRGKAVLDKKGKKVATIKDVVATPGNPADQVILTVGSILGFGGKDVRVPVDAFFVDSNGELVVAMTEEELENFPPVSAN